MPEFLYEGLDLSGVRVDGRLSADTREQAMGVLRQQGVTPLVLNVCNATVQPDHVVRRTSGALFSRHQSGLTGDQILGFIKELGSLLRAGLPLDRCLRVLSQTQVHPALKALQQELLDAVKAGRSLSQALASHPNYFGPLHINLVRAGELSGKLAQALLYLAEHLERGRTLRSSLVSALTYPGILLFTALLSVVLMLGFVVPQFKPLFNDLGDRLPLLTHMVVVVGDFLVDQGVMLLLVLGVGGALLVRWWATDAGRRQKEQLLLTLPLLGRLLLMYQLSQFTRTLGTLLTNGVGLMQAVVIARDGVSYVSLRAQLESLTGAIKQGHKFSRALADCQLMDPASLQLVSLGEETGRLDEMLLELTHRHEEHIQLQTRRALTLLEPLLILGLGLVVATIIIAILLGILSVNELVA